MRDTIFALATGAGRSAIAVMRVSGPAASGLLTRLAGPLPSPRYAALRRITGSDGEVVDEALALWFPGPASFTGEDVFELHLHGGPAIVAAVTQALIDAGARLAEPGEFTRRAFECGRLDLSQAEAIADLVDAETDAQRRQAISQLGGTLVRRSDRWRDILLDASAFLEAQIDFPDEDVPDSVNDQARRALNTLLAEIQQALHDVRGERIRNGLRIALIGAPNAGKSSLLNALIGRDAAIVTPIPGATRDVIEAPLVIRGYKVLLADMAGLRETFDPVEVEGVRRARAWAEAADLRLWLIDPSDADAEFGLAEALVQPGDLLVSTKADLGVSLNPSAHAAAQRLRLAIVKASVVDDGLASVLGFIEGWVVDRMAGAEAPAVTRERHRALLSDARDHLERAVSTRAGAELAAENVRLAARALESLSGRLDPDSVLDRVFGAFCIGK